DALFATLDPTTRRAALDDGREMVFTDTVGFVRHLPTQLVEAFRSTLEEVTGADLLLHVVDGADPLPLEQIRAVREVITDVIREQGTPAPPELLVVNKIDAADPNELTRLRGMLPQAAFVSAQTGAGVEELRERLSEVLGGLDVDISVLLPYSRGDLLARIHADGRIVTADHEEGGTRVRARVPHALAAALSEYAHAGPAEPALS
ncbi:GTPase, partial [Nocardia salmonicida]